MPAYTSNPCYSLTYTVRQCMGAQAMFHVPYILRPTQCSTDEKENSLPTDHTNRIVCTHVSMSIYIYVLCGCLGSVEDIQREIWPKCASVQLALNRFHTLFHPRRVRLQCAIALDSTREQRKPKAECIWRAIGIGVNCIRRTQCLD